MNVFFRIDSRLRFLSSAAAGLALASAACATESSSSDSVQKVKVASAVEEWPAMVRMEGNGVMRLDFSGSGNLKGGIVTVDLSPTDRLEDVESVVLRLGTQDCVYFLEKSDRGRKMATVLGKAVSAEKKPEAQMSFTITEDVPVPAKGEVPVWISVKMKPGADLDRRVGVRLEGVQLADRALVVKGGKVSRQRIGYAVAKSGDTVYGSPCPQGKKSLHFRIPGMVRAQDGSLVSVFDIRYDRHNDLPSNIDVGCSRSSDGGRSWSPVSVAMNYTGAPGNPAPTGNVDFSNDYGVGDPSILLDEATGNLWIAAIARKGIFNSKPGLTDDTTSQFVVSRSRDGGVTWEAPKSLNFQCKDAGWASFFDGPGHGITMKARPDGVRPIVFPAQIWNRGSSSCIVYSEDQGETWKCEEQGKAQPGLPERTSESTVVQLSDGSLMLSARHEGKSGKRVVYTTNDMGRTWQPHESNLKALPDPTCQGSLLSVALPGYGKSVLLFSNPATSAPLRRNMTLKASLDDGRSWTSSLLYDSRSSCGYSDICPIDATHAGVLYEGLQGDENLFFLRIPYAEILEGSVPGQ